MQIVEVNPPQLADQMEKHELHYVSIQNQWTKHVVYLFNYEQDQGSSPCVSTKRNYFHIVPFFLKLKKYEKNNP